MPPGRPKFDLEPFKGEITEAWNCRETNESIIKSLAAKGIEVNQKTFQRRLREWGLYRYNNKGAGKVRSSGVRKVATPTSPHARPPVVRTPAEVQRGAQEEIPDSVRVWRRAFLDAVIVTVGRNGPDSGTPSGLLHQRRGGEPHHILSDGGDVKYVRRRHDEEEKTDREDRYKTIHLLPQLQASPWNHRPKEVNSLPIRTHSERAPKRNRHRQACLRRSGPVGTPQASAWRSPSRPSGTPPLRTRFPRRRPM